MKFLSKNGPTFRSRLSSFKSVAFIAIGSGFLALIVNAQQTAPSTCVTTGSNNRVYMEQVSDSVGFCGAFAFRSALNQFICRERNGDCALPSVNAILGQTFAWFGPAHITSPLNLRGGMAFSSFIIPTEECFPFASFWGEANERTLRQGTFEDFYFHRMLAHVETKVIDPTLSCAIRNIYDNEKILPQNLGAILGRAFESTFRDLHSTSQARANQQNCRKVTSPPFDVNFDPYLGDMSALINFLDQGRAVIVGLRVPQPNQQSAGRHAVTVVNHRRQCCAGICSTQYQILDSMGFYWAPNANEGWVNEADLKAALVTGESLTTIVPANTAAPPSPGTSLQQVENQRDPNIINIRQN
jgi:hypothetical protein